MNKLKNILQITSMVLVMSVFFSSCKDDDENPTLAVPTSVAIPSGEITSSGFKINWKKVTGATEYYLDVTNDDKFTSKDKGSFKDKKTGNVETYTLATGLTAGTEYHVRIRAGKGSTRSGYSAVKKFTTKKAPLAKPTNVAITPPTITSSGFTVAWTKVVGATEYYLDVATANTFAKSQFVTDFESKKLNDVNTYPVTGLSGNKQYFVRLRASKAAKAQISDYSKVVSARTTASPAPEDKLATPVITVDNLTTVGFRVNWTKVTDAAEYHLDVSKDAGFANVHEGGFKNKKIADPNAISQVVIGLSEGVTYNVRLRASKTGGDEMSDYSTTATGTVATTPTSLNKLPQVKGVTIASNTLTENSATLQWNAVAGADKYLVDIATDAMFTSASKVGNQLEVSSGTASPLRNLTPYTTYHVRVIAQKGDDEGTNSPNSATFSFTTKLAEPVISSIGSVSSTGFTVNWGAVTNANKYSVHIYGNARLTGAAFKTAQVSSPIVSHAVINLQPATDYWVVVRALKTGEDGVESGNSAPKKQATSDVGSPTVPVSSITVAGHGGVAEITTPGGTLQMVETVKPDGATNKSITWSVLPADRASITTTGVLTAIKSGRVTVTATAKDASGVKGSVVINISGQPSEDAVPAPTGVAVTNANIHKNQFKLTWTAASGVDSYKVEVATDDGFRHLVGGTRAVPGDGAVSEFDVTALSSGTEYYVRVRSVKGSDESANEKLTRTVTTKGFKAPQNLQTKGSAEPTTFTVEWDEISGASYKVFVSKDEAFSDGGEVVAGYNPKAVVAGTHQLQVTPLEPSTTYYVKVLSVHSPDGDSDPSRVLSVSTTAASVPLDAPTNLDVKLGSLKKTEAILKWGAVAGADKYSLEVSTSSSFNSLVAGNAVDVTRGTEFKVTGLDAGTIYYARVYAKKDGATTSVASSTKEFTTKLAEPAITYIVRNSHNGFTVRWNTVTGADEYYIDVSENQEFTGTLTKDNIKASASTSHTFTDLKSNTPYWVRLYAVKSTDADIRSDASPSKKETTQIVPIPTSVAVKNADIKKNSFKVTWVPAGVATGHVMSVSTNPGFVPRSFVAGFKDLAIPGGGPSLEQEVTGLSSGTQYYVRVRTTIGSYVSDDVKVTGGVTTKGILAPTVTLKAGTKEAKKFTVQWTGVSAATHYLLDVATGSDFRDAVHVDLTNVQVNGLKNGPIEYLVSHVGIAAGTTYHVRVRGVTRDGESDNSETLEVTTLAALAAPTLLKLKVSTLRQNTFDVTWIVSTSVGVNVPTSQEISVSTASGFDPGAFVTVAGVDGVTYQDHVIAGDVTTTNEFSITGLTPSTPYHVKVCAVRGAEKACTTTTGGGITTAAAGK